MKTKTLYLIAVILTTAGTLLAPGYSSAQIIAGGTGHSLALCGDNTVRAWGMNGSGQLGNGTNTNSLVPVAIGSLTGIIAIEAEWEHSLAIKNDGTVWSWGNNSGGQLGNGTTISSNLPVQVSSLSGVIAIAAGWAQSYAVKNDGTVWAWGNNSVGQLGNGSFINSHIPVQVSTLTNVISISAGAYHVLAVKNDNTVWGWGHNAQGQLGIGNNTDNNIPVQLGLTNVIAVSAGSYNHSLALKVDGTVWAWGLNSSGQIGNGTVSNSNTPVQVSNVSNVIAIAGGNAHSLATKNDGTVWAWGWNGHGQLGTGNNTDSNVPVQVNNLLTAITIAAGRNHSLALKNDGTVMNWGENSTGQLGNGTSTNSNIPVQPTGLCNLNAGNAGTVSGVSPLCIGRTATYTSNGDPGGTWSSTNSTVATVHAGTGLVTALSAGTTDITYTVSAVSSFKILTISPNVNSGTVSGSTPLIIGQTTTYSSNGTAGGNWSSSNTSVATVNSSTGLVTAVGAGTTNITYTVSSGCGSPQNASKNLTVNPNVSTGAIFKIESGAILKTTGAVTMVLDNINLVNDGTLQQLAGEGSFKFTGATNSNISGTALPLIDIIENAKTGGAELQLQRNIGVGSFINFNSGIINLNGNNILLQPGALLNGESETSRITGEIGGFVEITRTLNAPITVNPGNLGAILTSTQNLGSTVIRRSHKAQSIGAEQSIKRYFDINPVTNLSLDATLLFMYFDAEMNGHDENTVALWKSPDNINWNDQGFDGRNATTNYVEKAGIDDFSRWTLAAPFEAAFSANTKIAPGKTVAGKFSVKVKFNVKVIPNPSHDDFTLQVESRSKEIIVAKIFDGTGRLVKQMKSDDFETLKFGGDMKLGVYLVEVTQGKNRKSLKLIKL